MRNEKWRDAFDKFAGKYDTLGDDWQDMGLDQVFKAGYEAAMQSIENKRHSHNPRDDEHLYQGNEC